MNIYNFKDKFLAEYAPNDITSHHFLSIHYQHDTKAPKASMLL